MPKFLFLTKNVKRRKRKRGENVKVKVNWKLEQDLRRDIQSIYKVEMPSL